MATKPKKPKQPPDPFKGAGHFKPRKPAKPRQTKGAIQNEPKSRKAKPVFILATPELVATIMDIRDAAAAAIARLDVLDVVAARKDFEWIRDVADEQLKAG